MCQSDDKTMHFACGTFLGTIFTIGLGLVITGFGANGYLATGLAIIAWPVICILLYGLFIELDKKNGR